MNYIISAKMQVLLKRFDDVTSRQVLLFDRLYALLALRVLSLYTFSNQKDTRHNNDISIAWHNNEVIIASSVRWEEI